MNTKRKWFFLGLLLVLIIAAVGFGAWQVVEARAQAAEQAAADSAFQTTPVRRGDLALSIAGSGNVIAAQTVELGFAVAGTVAELNVQVGDRVTQGQELARLAADPALTQAVKNQELAVQTAQQTLDNLQVDAASALAKARADVAAAEAAMSEAQANLHQPGDPRCAKSKTEEYYGQYLDAQKPVDEWEGYLHDHDTGYGLDYILERLEPMRKTRDQAYINWKYCEGYTEAEIQQSEADLQLAEATLAHANAQYQALQASGGIDQDAIRVAQAALDNAQLQLSKAQHSLEGARVVAPMDGTVMAVSGDVGDSAGTGTFITLTDLEHPRVQVSIDETDLPNFVVGCGAQVTFESLPGQTFAGQVSEVTPTLVTVQSVGMVQGIVDLENGKTLSGKTLPLGLAATVEVTCHQVENSLLVPLQALYEPADGAPYVYVLNAQGQPEQRTVTLGLKTVASVEILSGLTEGEAVVISPVEEP